MLKTLKNLYSIDLNLINKENKDKHNSITDWQKIVQVLTNSVKMFFIHIFISQCLSVPQHHHHNHILFVQISCHNMIYSRSHLWNKTGSLDNRGISKQVNNAGYG